MNALSICVLLALFTIVFFAVSQSIETIFGNARYPLAAAVTFLGLLGLLKAGPPDGNLWIDLVLIPYQALFASIVCLVIFAAGISLWSKISAGRRERSIRHYQTGDRNRGQAKAIRQQENDTE